MGTLPSEQVEILELAYYSGHTHVELSDLLGLPLETVKGRVRLAREKLRDRLEPGGTAAVAPPPSRDHVPSEAAIPRRRG